MLGDKEDKETIWPCQEAPRALFLKGLMSSRGGGRGASRFCFVEAEATKPQIGM